jgi:hypothetical protein
MSLPLLEQSLGRERDLELGGRSEEALVLPGPSTSSTSAVN